MQTLYDVSPEYRAACDDLMTVNRKHGATCAEIDSARAKVREIEDANAVQESDYTAEMGEDQYAVPCTPGKRHSWQPENTRGVGLAGGERRFYCEHCSERVTVRTPRPRDFSLAIAQKTTTSERAAYAQHPLVVRPHSNPNALRWSANDGGRSWESPKYTKKTEQYNIILEGWTNGN